MALVTIPVHGEILDPDGLTPAAGTVTFRTLIELRDVAANVVYMPATYVATLDPAGEFTIALPTTDNADIVPLNWVYQVFISTATWQATFYVQLPFAPGTTELADLTPVAYDPCSGQLAVTPLAPSEGALYVRKTGDTMTGNLSIMANLAVAGSASASFQGVAGDLVQMMATAMSTCIYNGGEITPNADPTKVDIAPATCWLFNYNSTTGALGPTNPQLTVVNYPGVTGLTPAFAPFTYYVVDSSGTLVQQATRPTAQQRRQNATLGLTLTQGGVIVVDQSLPVIPSQLNNQLVDLMEGVGPFSTQGNVVSSNGVNLTFKKTSGTVFSRAFNQIPNYLDPHNSVLAAQTPVNFRHITAITGSAGALTTLLNVGFYDPNGAGVLTPVGGGANTSTNFRVWGFANNTVNEQILVQYGQNTYASLAAAVAGLHSGNYIPQPATASGALLGWITVTRTATNLSDPTQAVFTKAAKFDVP